MGSPSACGLIEHELVNSRGDRVRLLNHGARIRSLSLALQGGRREVVLGYRNPEDYLDDRYYMGGIIGRFCNRIGRARFAVDGAVYRLSANDGPHHLHGGAAGFHTRRWAIGEDSGETSVTLSLRSADGDQGYPGALVVQVEYAWNDERELVIRYRADTDRPTHVNLTSHAYFNLAGRGDTRTHRLSINGDRVTMVDAELIPTGQLLELSGSPLDLQRPRRIGDFIALDHPLIRNGRGADLNYVLNAAAPAAELWNAGSDLGLILTTSCPGLQLYTGQHLGPPFRPWSGVCLEAQYFPDTPNHAAFPSTLVTPEAPYRETTTYRFVEGRRKQAPTGTREHRRRS